jgi:hypothetical protein
MPFRIIHHPLLRLAYLETTEKVPVTAKSALVDSSLLSLRTFPDIAARSPSSLRSPAYLGANKGIIN